MVVEPRELTIVSAAGPRPLALIAIAPLHNPLWHVSVGVFNSNLYGHEDLLYVCILCLIDIFLN